MVCCYFFGFLQKEHSKTVCLPECILQLNLQTSQSANISSHFQQAEHFVLTFVLNFLRKSTEMKMPESSCPKIKMPKFSCPQHAMKGFIDLDLQHSGEGFKSNDRFLIHIHKDTLDEIGHGHNSSSVSGFGLTGTLVSAEVPLLALNVAVVRHLAVELSTKLHEVS